MILVGTQLCYSPEPPAAYQFHGAGHGIYLMNDVEAWNLAWLVSPGLDLYLDNSPEAIDKMARDALPLFGLAAATVKRAAQSHFPDLRYLLSLQPVDFMNAFVSGAYQKTKIYEVAGPAIIGTMAGRVMQSELMPLPMRSYTLTSHNGFELRVPVPKFYEKVQR